MPDCTGDKVEMSQEKHYEMQWDCKYCGTEKLLGKTHRFCPNCGAAQDPKTRYFPSDEEKVAVEDHVLVGKDKICGSCGTLNSAQADYCQQCGAPMAGAEAASTLGEQVREQGGTFESSGPRDLAGERFEAEQARVAAENKQPTNPLLLIGIIAAVAVVIIGGIWFLNRQREATAYVTAHSWEREIRIESLEARRDGTWCDSMPGDAYNVSRSERQRSSRQVPDGEECRTVRRDNGDGTFSERQECQTVYRSEPVYDTYCDYTVDRWGYKRSIPASGGSLNEEPYWPALNLSRTGNCLGCEREQDRRETYTVVLREGENEYTCEVDLAQWQQMPIESTWTLNINATLGHADCSTLEPARRR